MINYNVVICYVCSTCLHFHWIYRLNATDSNGYRTPSQMSHVHMGGENAWNLHCTDVASRDCIRACSVRSLLHKVPTPSWVSLGTADVRLGLQTLRIVSTLTDSDRTHKSSFSLAFFTSRFRPLPSVKITISVSVNASMPHWDHWNVDKGPPIRSG